MDANIHNAPPYPARESVTLTLANPKPPPPAN